MSCARFDPDLVDRARGARSTVELDAALDRHLRECRRCRVRLEREQALSAGLRRLSEDTVAPPVDPDEEHRLLAAFDPRRPHAPERTSTRSLAVAALFLAAATLVWMVASRTQPSVPPAAAMAVPVPSPVSTVRLPAGDAVGPTPRSTAVPKSARKRPAAARRVDDDTRFVVLPGADDLPQFESGELMRVQLPASMVVSLGLRPPRPHDRFVQTDVLVGQDGYARAVRVVR